MQKRKKHKCVFVQNNKNTEMELFAFCVMSFEPIRFYIICIFKYVVGMRTNFCSCIPSIYINLPQFNNPFTYFLKVVFCFVYKIYDFDCTVCKTNKKSEIIIIKNIHFGIALLILCINQIFSHSIKSVQTSAEEKKVDHLFLSS